MTEPGLSVFMPTPPRRRKRWPWIAACGLLAAALAAGAALAIVGDDSPPATASTPGTVATAFEVTVGGACSTIGVRKEATSGVQVECDGEAWRVASTSAATEPPAAATTAPDLTERVGGVFSLSNEEGLNATYRLTRTATRTIDEFGDRPDRGLYFLVHIQVHVTGGSEFACSCSFQFVTSTGKVYEPTYRTFKGVEEFESADLAAGQNRDGWIAFDIPKATVKGGRVGFKPNAFGGEIAYWML